MQIISFELVMNIGTYNGNIGAGVTNSFLVLRQNK